MHVLTHPHVAGAWGTLEYSRRYLLLLMLMFYGTLMFALEYARAARLLQRFVSLSRQRSATFSVAPTADRCSDTPMNPFRIQPFNNLRSRRNVR